VIDDYNIKALAYLGDAVFELCVRDYCVKHVNARIGEINKRAKAYSQADGQEKMYHYIYDALSEREKTILKKGRNISGKRKNEKRAHRFATGLEALFGYLFINGQTDRINEIFNICAAACGSLK